MKKILFTLSVCLTVVQANATIHTVVTDGLHFVPENIAANVGDTIEFDLSPGFTATEVSPTVWTSNGNIPLVAQGAFDLESSNYVVMTGEGYRYFVCKWHHTTGMKGSIQVSGPAGVPEPKAELLATIYPVPTQNTLYLNVMGTENITVVIDIFDASGKKVMDLGAKQVLSYGVKPIDVSMLPAGVYYLNITMEDRIKPMRFVKQ